MKVVKVYSAVWCAPCQALKKAIKESDIPSDCVEIIDIDTNQQEAARAGIRSVPTMIFEENGSKVDQLVGTQLISEIKKRLL